MLCNQAEASNPDGFQAMNKKETLLKPQAGFTQTPAETVQYNQKRKFKK
uniref:Uncharacterized protein n=1 Tax=Nelumbo nucifera TaxID=4432 RepID=A0A822YB27_NELNU|nr:TPA_asm: hypothetical protein HUJ06_030209 [Nelumbo nucifera]